MTHKFTIEDIRMLAEMERKMDSGEQPYVLDSDRNRWAVIPEIMDELGLESGQSVNGAIITAILEAIIASIQAHIAVDAAAKATP